MNPTNAPRSLVSMVTILLHIQHTTSQIFPYTDHETEDHFRVYDQRTYTDKTHERFRRGLGNDPENFRRGLGDAPENYRRGLGDAPERFRRGVVKGSAPDISTNHTFQLDSYNVAFVFWKHAETKVIFILTCQTANTTNYNKHSNKGKYINSDF